MLDEPVNGLDTDGVRWIRQLLRGLADEGRIVLVSSHLLAEMQNTADQVVVRGAGPQPRSRGPREVLALVGGGLSNAEIAQKLFLTVGTVKGYVSTLLQRLGVRNRVEAAIVAYENGLLGRC